MKEPGYQYWQEKLALHVDDLVLADIATAFPFYGSGTVLMPGVLDAGQLSLLQEEVHNPELVPWQDNHVTYPNERGMQVEQNHLRYALKLSRGDPEPVKRLPRLRAVAANIEAFLQSDDVITMFSTTDDWVADEMSLHLYDEPEVGLSFHKDNLRFFGAIAVLAVEGQKEMWSIGRDGVIMSLAVNPGDLVLNRAGGLYPPRYRMSKGKQVQINECPDHGVYNLVPPAISFIVRANTRPDDPIKGFTYDNWEAGR